MGSLDPKLDHQSSLTRLILTVRDTYTPASLDDPFANAMDAYGTSKAAALAATESFMEKERLHFEVVNIMPSMVTGRYELNRKPEDVGKGSNGNTLGILLNKKSDLPELGASVHVNDVARAHIDALNPALRGNRNYLCLSGGVEGTTWNNAKDIVRRHFPKAVSHLLKSNYNRLILSWIEYLWIWEILIFGEGL